MDNYTPNPESPACPHCTDDVECADHAAKQVERCSCEESQHLRRALKDILRICTTYTGGTLIDDVAQCGNLADQALKLAPLVGDPGLTTEVRT